MKNIITALIVSFFFLAGCKESLTHEDLLEHPKELQNALLRCQANSEYTAYCDRVKQAGDEFTALLTVFGNDPLLFGKQILEAESELVKTKKSWEKVQQDYQAGHLPEKELAEANKKMNAAKEAYENQARKVRILLAVVSAASSEEM